VKNLYVKLYPNIEMKYLIKILMKKIVLALFILNIFFSPSCNVLEVEPLSDLLAENFYRDAGSAEAALLNCYNIFRRPVTQNYICVPSLQADEGFATRGGNFTRNQTFQTTDIQGNNQDTWRELYATIQACNDVLENVPGIQDPALNHDRVLGEALFIRSYSFFYLTRFYGKIPLMLEASKSANQNFLVSRDEVNVVLQQIIDDLIEAVDKLPAQQTNRARAAKASARALLAKAYLTRNASGDIERSLEQTTAILADSQYSLVSGNDYASIFQVGLQNTRESIFELSYRPNTSQASHALDQEFVPYPGNVNPRVRPDPKVAAKFLENPEDLRFPITLGFHNDAYYVRKYERNDVNESARLTQANNVVFLRLSDVILMHAEALNELNRTGEAIPFLNQIRQRAGIPNTAAQSQAEVRLAIEDERLLELCFEGHRWWDIVRTGRAMELCAPRLTNPDRIIWPIPGRDIDLNPNLLPQNPSY
jgi:starch-binding outer membrane protein, SusD/RagB family